MDALGGVKMKWTIHELIKLERQDNEIHGTIDIGPYLEGTDILRASPIQVDGSFAIYDQEEFVFDLHIRGTLILACAVTLDEVEYPIDIETEEVFTTFQDDDTIRIEGITIDLSPIIWSNILLDKPMRVVRDGAYDDVDFENTTFEDDVNDAFADLKDYDK
jgi:uncharacterized protein